MSDDATPDDHSRQAAEARREKARAYARAYYAANRERLKEQARAYHQAHRDERREYLRARYAANKERYDAASRAYYARRKAAGLCVRCGQPIPGDDPGPWKGVCAACAESMTRKAAAKRAARRRARWRAWGKPVCPRCGSTDLLRLRAGSRQRDGRRFRCRECVRWLWQDVRPRPGPVPYPCPYCGGPCRKGGYNSARRRELRCTRCGRSNTLLRANPNPAPPGPLRHRFVLYLGIREDLQLRRYCEERGLRAVVAVREICRLYAVAPTSVVTVRTGRDRWGDPIRVVQSSRPAPRPPLRFANAGLRDARSETSRKLWADKKRTGLEGRRLPRLVAVSRRLDMTFDDEAWEGLHRIMQVTGMTHQEAARWMIAQQTV